MYLYCDTYLIICMYWFIDKHNILCVCMYVFIPIYICVCMRAVQKVLNITELNIFVVATH